MRKLFFMSTAMACSLMLLGQGAEIQLKVYLQGAYAGGGVMTTHLNAGNHLPLSQPYNTGIWAYPGTEALTSIPAQMVDWILVDLRSAPDTAVARKACVLYSDGSVRDVNGNSQIQFNVPSGNYYVAVMHKSHLSAMSAARLALPAAGLLDFSDTATFPVYGRCVIQLTGGVAALIAGDITDDKMLKYSGSNNDRSPILQRILGVVGGTAINAIIQGYYREDLRMDGNVKYSGSNNDPSMIIQNLVTLTGSNAINATFTGPVPHAVFAPLPCYPQPDQANAGLDSLNIQDTVYQLTANLPVFGSGLWTVYSGSGGIFYDPSLHNTFFEGEPGEVYTLVWTISTVCGSSSDTVQVSFGFRNCGIITDIRDGQQYPTVIIGDQCWMAKNLNVGVYAISINTGSDHSDVSNNGIIEKYCSNNDTNLCNIYGGLYDWDEMMGYVTTEGIQGICPIGWHIPTDAEWTTLENYLIANGYNYDGTTIGNKIAKALASTSLWDASPYDGAVGNTDYPTYRNKTGFTALPASYRNYNGLIYPPSMEAYYWSSSQNSTGEACDRYLQSFISNFGRSNYYKRAGFSVRCLKDSIPPCTPQPDQADAGPDSLFIQGTSIQLQANVPVNGSGQWTVVGGMGGSFADDTLATTLYTGVAGSTYTLVWTISTVCGSSSDTVHIGFAFPNCGLIIDVRDGQQYPTVLIGNQCWMARNLNIGNIIMGTNTQINNSIIEKYCYDNDAANCAIYGGLYQWDEMMGYSTTPGVQGICPDGWHVPTDAEYCTLTTFLDSTVDCNSGGWSGTDAGSKMKEMGTAHWNSPNADATNSSGFTALGGGLRFDDGSFGYLNAYALLWTSSAFSTEIGIHRNVGHDYSSVHRGNYDLKTMGFSVRCIQGIYTCTPQPDQANAGPDSLNVLGTSIQLQANTPVNGSGQWSVVSGQGGSFADETQATTLFTGEAGSTYTLVWTISTVCGSSSDTVLIGFAIPQTFGQCGDILTDMRDGQQYPTVQIGNQCWMGRNLNFGTMVPSYETGYDHSDMANNGVVEKYCYGNQVANCQAYGGLYEAWELFDYQSNNMNGICPVGWHIPEDDEWQILEGVIDSQFGVGDPVWFDSGFRGSDVGGRLKEAGLTHWISPNTGATDSSGFTALPGGYRRDNGKFVHMGSIASFWTSTVLHTNNIWNRYIYSTDARVSRVQSNSLYGFSVRCILSTSPCTPQPDQANAGPDSLNLQGTSIQLQANIPVNGSGQWSVVSGLGGSFADDTLATTLFTGQEGSTYTLAWTISTVCGSSSDTVLIGFAIPQTFGQCSDLLTDMRDGQQYPTLQIGKHCWMGRNLNIGSMVMGVTSQQDNGILEKYCYDNDPVHCSIYGGLYQWNEAMQYDTTDGGQGICPDGWHIPTDSEWTYMTLILDPYVDSLIYGYSGRDAGGKLKVTGTEHWLSPNKGATNYSGFSALGAGIHQDTTFNHLHTFTRFWGSTLISGTYPANRYLYYNYAFVGRGVIGFQNEGFSVRCVHDSSFSCSPQPDQAYAGPDTIHTGGTSIQLMGNQPLYGLGEWTITVGIGGSFADSCQHNTMFYGQTGETYTLVWSISNLCNRTTDQVNISFSSGATFQQCGDTLTDTRDFQRYPTVKIGTQCWMAKNLNVGDMILGLSSPSNNGSIEKYCYVNNTANCTEYGGLYQWGEMMNYSTLEGSQGICPPGWHVPSQVDWTALSGYLGGNASAGGKMKETGTTHWLTPNTGATNESGFTALPTGRREAKGGFGFLDTEGNWWSSTYSSVTSSAFKVSIFHNEATLYNQESAQNIGYAVRCVLDTLYPCTPQPDQADAGPDSLNIQGTSVQLQANVPVNGSGQWSVVSGLGGSFADDTLATTLFTGQEGSTYSLAWTISTVCGSNSDTVTTGFAAIPQVVCPDSLLDTRDGQAYSVVQIGNQCWMGRNLNMGVMVSSQNLGYVHSDVANNMVIEKYCYNNDEANCEVYGGLYDWDEAMEYQTAEGSQGICPAGWHMPTDADWNILSDFLGGAQLAGGKMKEEGTAHWTSPNEMATNSSGFTGLGAGYRYSTGIFQNLMSFGYFWTSSADSNDIIITRTLVNFSEVLVRNTNHATSGFSIRCLMDTQPACTPQPDQADAGPDQLQVTGTSVQLAANQPVNGSGHWQVYSGLGGSFADSTLFNTTFTGTAGTNYQLAWIIQNACGYTSDLMTVSFAVVSMCPDSLIDTRDGQSYPVVEIDGRCWMARNLNIGVMTNSVYTGVEHADLSNDGIIEKYCYNNDPAQCDVYGGLYDWQEMMGYMMTPGVPGICPAGWHIPTLDEWQGMITYLGGSWVAGGKLKEAGFQHWLSPNTGATNSSGFTALPGNIRYGDGVFSLPQAQGVFWSSSAEYETNAWAFLLNYDDAYLSQIAFNFPNGLSVRCIMDTTTACSPLPTAAHAGPDKLGQAVTSLYLEGNQPVEGLGVWRILSGTGGVFVDSTLYNTLFSGLADEFYELSWTITTPCAYSTDKVYIEFVTPPMLNCGSDIYDSRDGQLYATVQIGTQCWMARNLNVGTFVQSQQTGYIHSDVSNNGVIEKYCWGNDISYCDTFGGLYDWNEMMGYVTTPKAQGICPPGWHVPDAQDWDLLSTFLGGDGISGGMLKDTGTVLWAYPNDGATNSSGFTALPGGNRDPGGSFGNMYYNVTFWSSTPYDPQHAYYRDIGYNGPWLVNSYHPIAFGFGVRCVANDTLPCTPQPDQADAGQDMLNQPGDSVDLLANVPLNGIGYWTILSGDNGYVSDPSDPHAILHGVPGQTYLLEWAITTGCGSTYDTLEVSFTSPLSFNCGSLLLDARDGQYYPTTQIGSHCWMAANLNIGAYVASQHTGVSHSDVSDNGIIEKYCYDNQVTHCDIYGGLYDWNEAMAYTMQEGAQGICPPDWHIPTDSEWSDAATVLGGEYIAGGRMKQTGTGLWAYPNAGATNFSGFNALPGGYRYHDGSFSELGFYGDHMSSTAYSTDYFFLRGLYNVNGTIYRGLEFFNNGVSVRCIYDGQIPCNDFPDNPDGGSDSLDIAGTTCVLQATAPLNGLGQWIILGGSGGVLSDEFDPNATLTGLPGEMYTLHWSISTLCASTAQQVLISFAASYTVCGGILVDTRDGQQYPTVQIGTQCWMARNLNVGVMVNSYYSLSNHSVATNNGIIEKYCYDNDTGNCDVYGGLYDWAEMMAYTTTPGIQGICPDGWHVPTDAEWCMLSTYLDSTITCNLCFGAGTNVGGRMKESGIDHWNSPNAGANNSSGFTALGAGARHSQGHFWDLFDYAYFWSSTEHSSPEGICHALFYDDTYVCRLNYYKSNGHSVRCLKNCSPQPDQADAGSDNLNMQGTSLTLQANQPSEGTGSWSIADGIGGSFTDQSLPNSAFNGTAGTLYTLVWTITNACGSTSDTVLISFAAAPSFTCGNTLIDTRDGSQYPTVQIGTQCWMTKNLNIGTQINASVAPTDNGTIEKHCYDNSESNCTEFGGLYTWNEAMAYQTTESAQGICPPGWVIPSDDAWTNLIGYLGGTGVAGGPLKETGTVHWNSPNTGATNTSGFTGVGGGYSLSGGFGHLKVRAYLWSSTSDSSSHAWMRGLYYNLASTGRNLGAKVSGFSVRCVKGGS